MATTEQPNLSQSTILRERLDQTKMFDSPGRFFFVHQLEQVASDNSLATIWFELEKAQRYKATGVYFRLFPDSGRSPVPQIYVYDFTQSLFDESRAAQIHKDIWSGGVVPLVYVYYRSELKIFDCTKPVTITTTGKELPTYLVDGLYWAGEISEELKKYRASLFDNGFFWEQEAYNQAFKFANSAYQRLLTSLKRLHKQLRDNTELAPSVIEKLLIQSILIKYLEERQDTNETRVFPADYFNQFGANDFADTIRIGNHLQLFDNLKKHHFSGDIFEWSSSEERQQLEGANLIQLADFLEAQTDQLGMRDMFGFRYYSFVHLPVELISRLYEFFLHIEDESKGLVYTPPHLARLLVDEVMPVESPPDDLLSYKILDPACGSGIFLVTAFKRLVQWWRRKNNYEHPTLPILKELLTNCIYGVDKKGQAVQLSRFSLSLALCDMLNPAEIWSNVSFEEGQNGNLIEGDFFKVIHQLEPGHFSLIIGNPPFIRSGIDGNIKWSPQEGLSISYPGKDIAFQFMADSLPLLKKQGIQCFIMPSSFLYNHLTQPFRTKFFELYHVVQVFDFTSLSRNQVLWDNAEPSTLAIFTRNQAPNHRSNVLHVTFRRTKATKDRLFFEVDEYDFHYLSRTDCNDSRYWKANLLGGGRLMSLLKRFEQFGNLETYIKENNWFSGQGYEEGNGKKTHAGYEDWYLLEADQLTHKGINKPLTERVGKSNFAHFPTKLFTPPNIVVNETLKAGQLASDLNAKGNIAFKKNIVAIKAPEEDFPKLENLAKELKKNARLYGFYLLCTSSQALVNRNTTAIMKDILNLPYSEDTEAFKLDTSEEHLLNDAVSDYFDFWRHGELSHSVKASDVNALKLYGDEFTQALNLLYRHQESHFQQKHTIIFKNIVYTTFVYSKDVQTHEVEINNNTLAVAKQLVEEWINPDLYSKRIIRLYSQNLLVVIKPNQRRYWLPSVAYRDVDKTFIDLARAGY